MAIVVEDGTGVENANSYISEADALQLAADRGLTLTADGLAPRLILAFEYIESKRNQYQGYKTYETAEAAQFPRENLYIDGYLVDNTTIPNLVKLAQVRVAVELEAGTDITPTVTDQVKREKVGPIETEYVTGAAIEPTITAVDALLAPLFKTQGGFSLTTYRG